MPLSSIRVVRGADDDAEVEAQRARQVGDAGRRQRAGEQHVDAGRREAGLERRLDHVARDARVLADQHRRPRAPARLQHLADRVAQAQHEVGRDRRRADRAADAVGAEIGSAHGVAMGLLSAPAIIGAAIGRGTRRPAPSTVAATSCTRTMRAPRSTASERGGDAGGSTRALAGERSAGACDTGEPASVDLRDQPASSGTPSASQLLAGAPAARGSAPALLPKPMPGSSDDAVARDAGGARRRRRRSRRKAATSATTSS